MKFTLQECLDLTSAILEAQQELCVDLEGSKYPEATEYYRRLEALHNRIKEYAINH